MEKILLNMAMSDTLRAITPAAITTDALACLMLSNTEGHVCKEHHFSMRFMLLQGNMQGQKGFDACKHQIDMSGSIVLAEAAPPQPRAPCAKPKTEGH